VITKVWRCGCKPDCKFVLYRDGDTDKYFLDESYVASKNTDILHDTALAALWDAVGEGGA
jgi:hypothetical protein